jgi:hypothetical protein
LIDCGVTITTLGMRLLNINCHNRRDRIVAVTRRRPLTLSGRFLWNIPRTAVNPVPTRSYPTSLSASHLGPGPLADTTVAGPDGCVRDDTPKSSGPARSQAAAAGPDPAALLAQDRAPRVASATFEPDSSSLPQSPASPEVALLTAPACALGRLHSTGASVRHVVQSESLPWLPLRRGDRRAS